MKKISIFILTGALLLSGCTKDFLKETPESFITAENLYTSEAGALAGLNAAYANLKNFRNSGRAMLIGVVGTDEGQLGIDEAGVSDRLGLDAYDGNFNAANPWITQMWRTTYLGIGRANAVLQNVPAIEMDENMKKRILAEASFLRALHYFWAVQLWGDIPIITKVIDNADQYNQPRQKAADVYNLIIEDLTRAETDLPDAYTGNEVGRATKGAAKALLGKVYLTAPPPQRDYAKAEARLAEVINSNKYELLPDFAKVFDVTNENNAESVFEVQFLSPDQTNNMSYATGSRAVPDNILGGGYAWFIPTDYMYGLYEATDTRNPVTFRTRFYDASGQLITSSANLEHLKPHVKKFEDPTAEPASANGKNTYILRYADVILMYAEALNEQGKTAQAEEQLNLIRSRAKTTLATGLNQEQLRDAILTERLKELAFEGWRWYDLRRTGNLVALAGAHNPRAAANISETNNLFPIPLSEINNNEGIGSEDQNPGY